MEGSERKKFLEPPIRSPPEWTPLNNSSTIGQVAAAGSSRPNKSRELPANNLPDRATISVVNFKCGKIHVEVNKGARKVTYLHELAELYTVYNVPTPELAMPLS